MSNTDTNNRILFLVARLDMAGQVLCQVCSGTPVPENIRDSALRVLRSCRDEIAHAGGITQENAYSHPAFVAEMMLTEMEGEEGA
jgi:hypothetical protein